MTATGIRFEAARGRAFGRSCNRAGHEKKCYRAVFRRLTQREYGVFRFSFNSRESAKASSMPTKAKPSV